MPEPLIPRMGGHARVKSLMSRHPDAWAVLEAELSRPDCPLSPRERAIIAARRGGHGHSAIAQAAGCTAQRILQLEARAVEKLARRAIAGGRLRPSAQSEELAKLSESLRPVVANLAGMKGNAA